MSAPHGQQRRRTARTVAMTARLANGQSSWGQVFTSRATATNFVALGPNIANNTVSAHYVSKGWSTFTYNGYIWNRSSEPATWTFASSIFPYVAVYIDGRRIVEKNGYGPPAGDPERYTQIITNITLS